MNGGSRSGCRTASRLKPLNDIDRTCTCTAAVWLERLDDNVWRDRPVLVIGGLGFIGLNLTRKLAALGARPTVLARTRSGEADALERDGVTVLVGDVRDMTATAAAVAGQQVVF